MSTPPQDTAALTTGSEQPSSIPEVKEWVVGDLAEIKYSVNGQDFVWKLRFTDANINKSLHELVNEILRGIWWDNQHFYTPRRTLFFDGAVAGTTSPYTQVRALKDRNLHIRFFPPERRIRDYLPSPYY